MELFFLHVRNSKNWAPELHSAPLYHVWFCGHGVSGNGTPYISSISDLYDGTAKFHVMVLIIVGVR